MLPSLEKRDAVDLEQHQHKSYVWEELSYGSSFYSIVTGRHQIFDITFWTANHCKNFQKLLSIQAPISPNFSSMAFRIFPLLYIHSFTWHNWCRIYFTDLPLIFLPWHIRYKSKANEHSLSNRIHQYCPWPTTYD